MDISNIFARQNQFSIGTEPFDRDYSHVINNFMAITMKGGSDKLHLNLNINNVTSITICFIFETLRVTRTKRLDLS